MEAAQIRNIRIIIKISGPIAEVKKNLWKLANREESKQSEALANKFSLQ